MKLRFGNTFPEEKFKEIKVNAHFFFGQKLAEHDGHYCCDQSKNISQLESGSLKSFCSIFEELQWKI